MSDGILSGLLVEAVARSICVNDYDTCYARNAHRTQARNAIAVVSETLRSDETRQKITEVLAENGVQPNTDAMHSWRCNEPDRYPGYCSCVPQLVDELIEALAGGDE